MVRLEDLVHGLPRVHPAMRDRLYSYGQPCASPKRRPKTYRRECTQKQISRDRRFFTTNVCVKASEERLDNLFVVCARRLRDRDRAQLRLSRRVRLPVLEPEALHKRLKQVLQDIVSALAPVALDQTTHPTELVCALEHTLVLPPRFAQNSKVFRNAFPY
jgi:hypothetical protein